MTLNCSVKFLAIYWPVCFLVWEHPPSMKRNTHTFVTLDSAPCVCVFVCLCYYFVKTHNPLIYFSVIIVRRRRRWRRWWRGLNGVFGTIFLSHTFSFSLSYSPLFPLEDPFYWWGRVSLTLSGKFMFHFELFLFANILSVEMVSTCFGGTLSHAQESCRRKINKNPRGEHTEENIVLCTAVSVVVKHFCIKKRPNNSCELFLDTDWQSLILLYAVT